MLKKLSLILFLVSCSTPQRMTPSGGSGTKVEPKEFSRGELILGTQLLTKIFDQEMAPLECVPDTEEASLLLRTIRPRMEIVEDDIEALLDEPKEVEALIRNCHQNCTCGFIDDLLKEHEIPLTKTQQKTLNTKRSERELNRCLSYQQKTFCKSELYKTLNEEKADFSFEETP